jgi:NAD(P)-dependent dehydrogenase (short-subunit alcohol dehydrogenase family)
MTMMDLDLSGKTALVTAAVSGIGLATCQGLAARGASIWMNGRSPERLEKAAAAVRARVPGAQVRTVVGDVATVQGCKAITDAATDIDILINMAGGTDRVVPFLELTDEDWQYQWDFNIMSGVRLTRHYVPMFQKKDYGRIIFLTSCAGLVTPGEIVDYGVVKAGVMRLSRCIAELFSRTGVTANCVMPGPTLSEWVYKTCGEQDFDAFEERHFQVAEPTSLLGKFAEADDVANLIVYLSSPASAATRGAVLRAEGGIVRTC